MSQTKAQLISDLVQALNFTGTASAPANGAFLSATNTLALATNSAQRLTIDSTGDVGIGTSSPTFSTFGSNTGGIEISDVGSSANALLVQSSSNEFFFANTSSANYIYGADNAPLIISTNGSERMRIKSDGTVGIGTTNPTSKLDLHIGTDNTGLQITSTDAGAFASYFDNTGASTIGHSGTSLVLSCDPAGSVSSSNIVFQVDSNNERMRIDSSGNVGIGTNSPTHRLHVIGDGSNNLPLKYFRGGSGVSGYLYSDGGGSGIVGSDGNLNNTGLYFVNDTSVDLRVNGSARLLINSSGNVGIGTTSPEAILHVNDSGNNGEGTVKIGGQNTNTGATLFYEISGATYLRIKNLYRSNSSNGANAYIEYDGGYHKFLTGTGGTERIRIDSSGRLLYGLTSSTRETSLILQGNSNSYITNPGTLEVRIGQVPSAQTTLGQINFGCTGDKIGGTISAIADNADWSSGSSHPTAIRFFTTPASSTTQAERMRISSTGSVGIGTTSPDQTLHVHKGSAGSISSTGNSVLTLENSNDSILQFLSPSSNVNQIRFGDPADNGAGYIDYNHGNNALTFGTNGPEKMRLDASGNLGIGTTSPSNRLHIKDGNPYLEIEGTSNSGDAGIFFNAKSNHWNLRADNSGSQNSFGLKSGTPASSTHTISIVGQTIDFFQNRNIYQRTTSATHSIADGANKQFTITGLGYGWAKLQLAFYGEGDFCNVEVSVGGLMASGGTFYGATVIANNSSSDVDVAFGSNQTSYVVTISNNVGNGGSIHGTALFTGSGSSAHPNIAVS